MILRLMPSRLNSKRLKNKSLIKIFDGQLLVFKIWQKELNAYLFLKISRPRGESL